MKRKDLFSIFLAAIIGGLAAFFISGLVFSPPSSHTKVAVVDKIDSTFPDTKNDSNYYVIFNKDALDLTLPIQIGPGNNDNPFTQNH